MTKYWHIAVLLVCLSSNVAAHNVIGGVYAIGNDIEGEIGFSNGDMAKEGTVVVVSDVANNEIGRVETDAEGLFVFVATARIDHVFRADLSAGHVIELRLPADELPDSLPSVEFTDLKASSVDSVQSPSLAPLSAHDASIETMIEKAVAKQIKPLRQELAAYKEKASFQDVLGGIGYIFGLCGIGIWLRQRKQAESKKNVSQPNVSDPSE